LLARIGHGSRELVFGRGDGRDQLGTMMALGVRVTLGTHQFLL
jgi:hypothetical protein